MFQQILNITHHWRSIYNYISLWYILQDIAYIFWQRCVSFFDYTLLTSGRGMSWLLRACKYHRTVSTAGSLLASKSFSLYCPIPEEKYICRCQNKLTTAAIGMLNLYLMSLPLRKNTGVTCLKKAITKKWRPWPV